MTGQQAQSGRSTVRNLMFLVVAALALAANIVAADGVYSGLTVFLIVACGVMLLISGIAVVASLTKR